MVRYKTGEVANIIGVHANTVRLYEKEGLISPSTRADNGYRIFNDKHIEEFKLARAALKSELLQNGLRKKTIAIIRLTVASDYQQAEKLTHDYIKQLDNDTLAAEEALQVTQKILLGLKTTAHHPPTTFKRAEVAQMLNVTIDTLRNWELNGLFEIRRKANGYRVYTEKDIEKLKIIRSLRHANYSLTAILRMLIALSYDPNTDIRTAIDDPVNDEIIRVCDKLLSSLAEAKANAAYVLQQLDKLKQINPPL